MLQFRDFVPRQTSPPGILQEAEYDSFDAAAEAAAHWVDSKGVKLVHVETVVLPNVHSPHEAGTHDSALHTSGRMYTTWYQIVRVWYEET